ncbi:MAG: hypothetical protein M1814_000830 [Vezdaea aestivalis]|nr:MAG: hypothetical protein M1814_000830 [Vezdaea aestivalis]
MPTHRLVSRTLGNGLWNRSPVLIPTFLAPALLAASPKPPFRRTAPASKCFSQEAQTYNDGRHASNLGHSASTLSHPIVCPGCGALGQSTYPKAAGFYNTRKRMKRQQQKTADQQDSLSQSESQVIDQVKWTLDENTMALLGLDAMTSSGSPPSAKVPLDKSDEHLCSRCHQLMHHNFAVPAAYPTIDSIRDTIAESPHRVNHVYHVIDAADFPMSLIPNLLYSLNSYQRSHNRRSRDRVRPSETEITFVITRADLLARTKPDIDRLLPRVTEILRTALGRTGRNIRLGNVRLVSARRNWWTKELKDSIARQRGAGWFVGKVNVGKSRLFHEVFPKGMVSTAGKKPIQTEVFPRPSGIKDPELEDAFQRRMKRLAVELRGSAMNENDEPLLTSSKPEIPETYNGSSLLLPPRQKLQDYPAMPLVNSLSGTTVSPIRVPFGIGGGELIDLPGLYRSSLEDYVEPESKSKLLLLQPVEPLQLVIKPGQSLLLGGLFRITPVAHNSDLVLLAFPFLNFDAHVTSTEKAIEIQQGLRTPGFNSIAKENIGPNIKSAGVFQLSDDVTKVSTGSLTANDAGGMRPVNLTFKVLGTDVLIEGCGFVEVRTQVRKRLLEGNGKSSDRDGSTTSQPETTTWLPSIEIFSPEGKFIGTRTSLSIGSLLQPKRNDAKRRSRRPIRITHQKSRARQQQQGLNIAT